MEQTIHVYFHSLTQHIANKTRVIRDLTVSLGVEWHANTKQELCPENPTLHLLVPLLITVVPLLILFSAPGPCGRRSWWCWRRSCGQTTALAHPSGIHVAQTSGNKFQPLESSHPVNACLHPLHLSAFFPDRFAVCQGCVLEIFEKGCHISLNRMATIHFFSFKVVCRRLHQGKCRTLKETLHPLERHWRH